MARPRSDIRPRLIAAARDRFLLDGVDGASLRNIARDANTNIGMLYYYFETKESLFFEVVEEHYGPLLTDLEEILGNDTAITDRLERVSIRIGNMSEGESKTIRIVVREVLASTERRERLFKRFRDGHISIVMKAIEGAMSSGQLSEQLPLPVMMMASFGIMVIPQAMRLVAGSAGSPLPFKLLPDAPGMAKAMRYVLENGILGSKEPS